MSCLEHEHRDGIWLTPEVDRNRWSNKCDISDKFDIGIIDMDSAVLFWYKKKMGGKKRVVCRLSSISCFLHLQILFNITRTEGLFVNWDDQIISGLHLYLLPALSKPASQAPLSPILLWSHSPLSISSLCPPCPPLLPAGYSFHNTGECLSLNEMEMVEDYWCDAEQQQ